MAPVAMPLSATCRKNCTSGSEQAEVGGIEHPLGFGVNHDHWFAGVVADLEQFALSPAAHDHVILGHSIVPILGKDRAIELLDEALEARDILKAFANDVTGDAVARHYFGNQKDLFIGPEGIVRGLHCRLEHG